MASRFEFLSTPLAGLKIVQRKAIEDSRGFLSRFFCAEEFSQQGLTQPVRQMNHTLTRARGAVRGMHFQHPPHTETKIVSCLKGEVFDVAVDLRASSPTFLKWHGAVLSEHNRQSFWIPDGFAHGFQTLTENCELVYLHTESYHPEAEGALHAMDARLRIAWPLPITDMSDRDRQHAAVTNDFKGIVL